MSIDKAALLAKRLPEIDVPVGELGTVRVRALSRTESMSLKAVPEEERETHVFALAFVDPVLTLDEAAQLRDACPPGDLESVSTAIGELSGLLDTSEKDAYKSDGSGAGS